MLALFYVCVFKCHFLLSTLNVSLNRLDFTYLHFGKTVLYYHFWFAFLKKVSYGYHWWTCISKWLHTLIFCALLIPVQHTIDHFKDPLNLAMQPLHTAYAYHCSKCPWPPFWWHIFHWRNSEFNHQWDAWHSIRSV